MEKKTRYIGNFYGFGRMYDGAVFYRGMCAPTLRAAQNHGSAPYTICKYATRKVKINQVQMIKRTIVIGQMDNTKDHTFESANRVYDKRACAPTINTCGGGGLQAKVIKKHNKVYAR